MTDYASTTSISEFLQVDNFTDSSKPTKSTVEDRIEEAEDYIDSVTGHSWRTTIVSDELHSTENSYIANTGTPVYLSHRKVKAFDSSSGDKLEVWEGNAWVDWLASSTRTEGRNNDYWVDYEQGLIYIRTWTQYPISLRATYRFGEASVPKDIQKATVLLAAIDLVASDDRSVLLPESGTSQLSYSSKIDRWQKTVDDILERKKEFFIPTR